MCANYTPSSREAFSQHYGIELPIFDHPAESFPGYLAPILRHSPETGGQIECVPAVFGLVPHWADMKLARSTYNARTETVASKPSFRNAWKKNQFCIVPAHFIYEPNYDSGKPIRWRIGHVHEQPLSIAGIWEWKPNGPDGQPVVSFSMLTINADAHPLMNRFHKPGDEKRMPMMLPPQQVQAWLAGALVNAPEAFAPFPAEQLIAIPDPLPARRGNKARTSESDAPQQSGLAFT